MSKKSSKEQYPIELPSREDKSSYAPITDVVENELPSMEVSSPYSNLNHKSGAFEHNESIAEVVTTEISPDTAERTIHGQ